MKAMSNNPVVPREKQSAYQRWELHSFDMPNDYNPAARAKAPAADDAAKIESARRTAYESGRADGLREGTAAANEDARHLRELCTAITLQSREINQQLADDLLRLSLTLAQQMVRRSLAIHPESIITVIQDALAQLSTAATQLTLTLHPADAALVRTHLAEQIESGSWNLVENASIRRGGAVLHSAVCHVDATIETRWQHLTRKLGLDDAWLD